MAIDIDKDTLGDIVDAVFEAAAKSGWEGLQYAHEMRGEFPESYAEVRKQCVARAVKVIENAQ